MGHTQGESRTVEVGDGRELHYAELPGSGPVVVFESGLAASRSFWGLVQPRVGGFARAVVYDRAGLGRSTPAADGSFDRLVRDLGTLLNHLGDGPFVLVAHSGGGPVVRAAAARDPARIAGLVLVDTTDEACTPMFDRSFRRLERVAHVAGVGLARIGLLPVLMRAQLATLPADCAADLRAEGFTARAMRTRGVELAALVDAMNAFRVASPELPPDLPVTSISGGRADTGMSAALRRATTEAHAYRAGRSTRGRHVVARKSGHMVVLTEPDLVADEVRRLVGGTGAGQ
ncbi:alpha/beta fold hydrolase [Saccharothrix obliqua]|uniref:alpha/beta fold hydrolase n=1 Tax=Saccharothrix obliqua TaxID=2861747 RepID=UPI001C5D0E62|nr:alpha/beta hydrolase [Saccharothrix obliqua]MBW4718570.1 alpha/beta hydrolase [Saccharothrix obliqua]